MTSGESNYVVLGKMSEYHFFLGNLLNKLIHTNDKITTEDEEGLNKLTAHFNEKYESNGFEEVSIGLHESRMYPFSAVISYLSGNDMNIYYGSVLSEDMEVFRSELGKLSFAFVVGFRVNDKYKGGVTSELRTHYTDLVVRFSPHYLTPSIKLAKNITEKNIQDCIETLDFEDMKRIISNGLSDEKTRLKFIEKTPIKALPKLFQTS